MKRPPCRPTRNPGATHGGTAGFLIVPLGALALLLSPGTARASIAYGSINNFDTVNDTGKECHGFEIEIEDCRSSDISHTYNYNHYGTPRITQDDSVTGHPKCIIRWESRKNPDGSWAAYTAIPAGPIAATNGHQFTNPGVNFGGEHFGVGYLNAVGAVRYQWLVDDGAGNLVHGGAVQVATPVFTYFPPVAAQPAQVQAAIEPPPEPPEVPSFEFGPAVWVREIRTTTHNNRKVRLRDLVSDDPDDPDDVNWRNGEPDEVEVEWQILQKELTKPDGGNNGRLVAAPEDLDEGDEVVTRRYEFYEYTGPIDEETGEALAEKVGPDDRHGVGIKEINGEDVDLSTVVVVGGYQGAQMAAVDAAGHLDLIDHLGEGEEGVAYADRRIVLEGQAPFASELTGELPAGMRFDPVGGILSGTPAESGRFAFTVSASDGTAEPVSANYVLSIAAAGEALPPSYEVRSTVTPVECGTITGDGFYPPGAEVTLVARPAPGCRLVDWTEHGEVVGTSETLTLPLHDVNHTLVARFAWADAPTPLTLVPEAGSAAARAIEWSLLPPGWMLEESSDLSPGSWVPSTRQDAPRDGMHHVGIGEPDGTRRFFRLNHQP